MPQGWTARFVSANLRAKIGALEYGCVPTLGVRLCVVGGDLQSDELEHRHTNVPKCIIKRVDCSLIKQLPCAGFQTPKLRAKENTHCVIT